MIINNGLIIKETFSYINKLNILKIIRIIINIYKNVILHK